MVSTDTSYQDALEALAGALKSKSCALFIGPSCSEPIALRSAVESPEGEVASHQAIACGLAERLATEPGWDRRREPCKNCDANSYGCVLPEVAWRYEARHGSAKLLEFMRKLLQKGSDKPLYYQLWSLPFCAVYTLDYDDGIRRSTQGAQVPGAPPRKADTEVGASRPASTGQVMPYQLMHSIDGDPVVTMEDRYELRTRRKETKVDKQGEDFRLWDQLQRDMATKTFLFVGYGLVDTEVLDVLYPIRQKGQFPQSFALAETVPPSLVQLWYGEFNVVTITEKGGKFIADLIEAYNSRWQRPPARRLRERQPEVWAKLQKVLGSREGNGVCVYGNSDNPEINSTLTDEFSWIAAEVLEECQHREGGEVKVLPVHVDVAKLGASVRVDPERIINLVTAVTKGVADQLQQVGCGAVPAEPTLADRTAWSTRAEDLLSRHYIRQVFKDEKDDAKKNQLVKDALDGDTEEHRRKNRIMRESHVANQAGDWLAEWLTVNVGDGLRLLVLITDFDQIDADPDCLGLICKHVLDELYERNQGVFIMRRASTALQWPPRQRYPGMEVADEIDLAHGITGGVTS